MAKSDCVYPAADSVTNGTCIAESLTHSLHALKMPDLFDDDVSIQVHDSGLCFMKEPRCGGQGSSQERFLSKCEVRVCLTSEP